MRDLLQNMGVKKDDLKKAPPLPGGDNGRVGVPLTLIPTLSRYESIRPSRKREKELIFLFVLLVLVLFHASVLYSASKTFKDEVGREVIVPFLPRKSSL